jgi:hypothetical protein
MAAANTSARPEDEVRGVEGAHAAAGGEDVLGAAEVVVDERRHLVDDPGLVAPAVAGVERVDAVDLDAARLEQVPHGLGHPAVLEVPRAAALGRERDHWTAVVAVHDDAAGGADRGGVQLHDAGAHAHTLASSRVRCG